MVKTLQFAEDHALTFLLTIAVVFTFLWLCSFKERLKINSAGALVISILHVVFGVLCVKVFAVFEAVGDLSAAGNMSIYGGIFFMPIAYAVGAKLWHRKMSEIFDVFTICLVFTLMCARVNCLMGGCCQGKVIPFLQPARWPTRELEILFYVILMIYFIPKIRSKKTDGEVYPAYLMSYGVFRFITEFLRVSDRASGLLHISHLWSAIAAATGMSIYFEIIHLKSQKQKKTRR